MNSQLLLERRSDSSCTILMPLLFIVLSFVLQTPTIKAQPTQQPIKPQKLQGNPPVSPLPLIEDDELKEFDSLPIKDKETKLATNGPLIPQKYNLSNFSMRVFLKGNSPLVIDYALEPNSTALITISTEGADLFLALHESEMGQRILGFVTEMPPPGRTPIERGGILILQMLVKKFLLHPEKSRRQYSVALPAEFGERPQPGKISIQAFSRGPGDVQPAYFRLYGLAMGSEAVLRTANTYRANETMSNHSRVYMFPTSVPRSTAIDRIELKPVTVNIRRQEKVKYRIHSQSTFNNVKVVFHRMQEIGNVSFTEVAHAEDLGPITENGWLQPREWCVWDGKSRGVVSVGVHDLEVRAWLGLKGAWASAWSNPKRVRIY